MADRNAPEIQVDNGGESRLDRKTVISATVFLCTLASTACGTVYSKFQTSGVTSGETTTQINQNILSVTNSIDQKRKQIINENLLFQEFMEDSGAMEFNRFGFSAGLSFMTRSYDDYLDMCRAVNATLASPRNYEDFQAMSTVASKRGHCYVGLKRNNNNEWLSPDNKPVSVPPNYWDKSKNEPKTAPDFLCAYLYNSGKSSFLSSASCGGDNPAIKCFICYKPA